MRRLLILIFCHNYHQRLALTIKGAVKGFGSPNIVVGSSQTDILNLVAPKDQKYVSLHTMSHDHYLDRLLFFQNMVSKSSQFDFVLMLDADILCDKVFYDEYSSRSHASDTVYWIPRRMLSEADTETLLKTGETDATGMATTREPFNNPPWGYFMLMGRSAWARIISGMKPNGNRVHLHDTKFKKRAKRLGYRFKLLPGTAYHLWHGELRANWNGTEKKW